MAGLLATTEVDIFIWACHCERSPVPSMVQGGAKQSRILDTIDGSIKTFYLIRITKGRRKQTRDLRDDILKGNKNRMT